MRPRVLFALALLCGFAATPVRAQPSPKALLPDIPLPILQSLAYVDIEPGRAVALVDGTHDDGRRRLRLEPSLLAKGDLDNDGTRDAAVLIEQRLQGVPTLYVAAVVQRAGRIRNMASLRLGEHVQVRSLTIEHRIIVLSLLVPGEGDAAARPTLKMTLGLKLDGSELQLMRQEPRGRFTVAELAGTSWRLAAAAGATPAPTGWFAADGAGGVRLSGRGPCSHFSAGFTSEGTARQVSRGAALNTRLPCAAAAAAAETDFLARLGNAALAGFSFGRLALADGQGGIMLWQPE